MKFQNYFALVIKQDESQSTLNKGLTGNFNLAVIPDSEHYKVHNAHILKDGCGYIKASVAEIMNLSNNQPELIKPSSLTYQALQFAFFQRHRQGLLVSHCHLRKNLQEIMMATNITLFLGLI